jgi:hypothetical protein
LCFITTMLLQTSLFMCFMCFAASMCC